MAIHSGGNLIGRLRQSQSFTLERCELKTKRLIRSHFSLVECTWEADSRWLPSHEGAGNKVGSTAQEAGRHGIPNLGSNRTKAKNDVNGKAQRERKEPEKIKGTLPVTVSSSPIRIMDRRQTQHRSEVKYLKWGWSHLLKCGIENLRSVSNGYKKAPHIGEKQTGNHNICKIQVEPKLPMGGQVCYWEKRKQMRLNFEMAWMLEHFQCPSKLSSKNDVQNEQKGCKGDLADLAG